MYFYITHIHMVYALTNLLYYTIANVYITSKVSVNIHCYQDER